MATRFNRMNYFKRFDATQEFVALKSMTLGGVALSGGDQIDKDSVSIEMIRKLFRARKVGFAEASKNPAHAAKIVRSFENKEPASEIAKTEPKIVGPQKGGWFKVMLGDTQIGDSTRDQEEAELVVLEWLEENPNGLAT